MGTSLNGVVVYKSRYGSTQKYGEWISKALRIPMIDPERLDDRILSICDFLLIGTPVYRGKMLISDWLRQNETRLKNTRLFLFIVCTHYSDIEQQQLMIKDNIPSCLLDGCVINFFPGKLATDSLTSEDSTYLGLSAAPEETTDPVQQENITPLLENVRHFAAGAGVLK